MLKRSHSLRRLLLIETGILILVAGSITLVVFCQEPIQIGYHRVIAHLSMKAIVRSTKSSQGTPNVRHTRRYESHRDELIRLGYLDKHTYTYNTNMESLQRCRMLADVHRKIPGQPYEFSIGKSISIIDRPYNMAMWDEFVQKYDASMADPCQPANSGDSLNASPSKIP